MPDRDSASESSYSFSFPALPGDVTSILSKPQQPDEMGRLGSYRVLRVLGEGGMGLVFAAEDSQRRQLALKVMRPELARNAAARERFVREARAASLVEHEHIITVHQISEEKGVPYLAMPLLEGQSLHERLHRAGGPLLLTEAVRIGREMAEGLAAAHAAGLIHRDIKPANVWLEARTEDGGRVKLLDFGLVRLANEESNLTGTGTVLGTPSYMAPEQARGRKVDGRADLFSLGCILYEMCTGERAFKGEEPMNVLLRLSTEEPPPVQARNPQVPAALSHLIERLMAKKPEFRPASAKEVAVELAALAADPALAREAALPAAIPLEETSAASGNTWAGLSAAPITSGPHAAKGGRRGVLIAVVAAALAVAAVGVLALLWFRGTS